KAATTTVVTITGAPFTYTGSAIEPATVSVTGAGGLSLTPTAVYADNTNAGTATASYTYAETANYLSSSDSEDFTIGKAQLTATADYKTKYCGQANPALTFQYSGWVNGVETIDTPPIIATTVNATTSAGIYTGSIMLSGGLDNNYSFSFVAGTLTVYGVSIDASASSAPVALGSVATLSATVTSTVSGNLSGIPVIFTLDNGNGTPITYPAVSTDSNGLATYSVSGLSVEVYKIMVVAGSGCASSTAYLAVYDPNGGFVTGGGWINSPLGAYTANPALTGKANFGFNAKYKKGSTQVDGNTEFQFQTGNLNFSSSSHDAMSLVIAGAQAIYKGKGTINGISGFSFMVSAIDGNKKSPIVPDKFRIKIWNTLNGVIVYDNQIGAADNADAITSLGGGSIVIHEVKKNGTAKAVIVEETPEIEPFAITAYPNPSAQYFVIEIKGGTTEKTEVIVYDILGRMVKHIQNSDSKEIKFGEELSSGSYIAIINQGTQQKTVRLIKQ
ncbi:MBG domain-containing protein, partial [Flavobacterium sp. LB3P6]|uniref:MBG domain-containing protein n=2 Tax=Flavobacterium TaxID=237 RepID=UPI003AACA8DD